MKIHFFLLLIFTFILTNCSENNTQNNTTHNNVTSTLFWIGEDASEDNTFIQNHSSAWDDNWENNYGGIDNPYDREHYTPSSFINKENSFYFALPYNDFDLEGHKKNIMKNQIDCKNRWVKITKNNKSVYAQWEDVGPFGEDDYNYVFGLDKPKNKINNNAGIDLSPAVHDYLNLNDIDIVTWIFIDQKEVPPGPWLNIITKSPINWI